MTSIQHLKTTEQSDLSPLDDLEMFKATWRKLPASDKIKVWQLIRSFGEDQTVCDKPMVTAREIDIASLDELGTCVSRLRIIAAASALDDIGSDLGTELMDMTHEIADTLAGIIASVERAEVTNIKTGQGRPDESPDC
ncbi:hypothetical protein V6C03_06460 [Methyloligella sp. 2.7D]|uniref:hypothetical protein n=1 Tax=unclassified Methyloligella TaxID=2625955 RepID=UPI00157C58E5|nr:hypothetical protein [Methyloligella sp. GL2]QKP78455.1 hypothetical protein HT051_13990 [Methyloligella sp. GL2]